MCPQERFSHYKKYHRLVLSIIKDWATCCTLLLLLLVTLLQIILLSNYLSKLSYITCSETLLKTACQFLLLLVGFDTLTYRKDYDSRLEYWTYLVVLHTMEYMIKQTQKCVESQSCTLLINVFRTPSLAKNSFHVTSARNSSWRSHAKLC